MSFKVKDHYFKKAKKNNFVARSIFKLEEIDKKFNILKKQIRILDLGYYPGSWLQYASPIIGNKGHIYGVDLKPINEKLRQSLKNITLLQMNCFQLEPVWNGKLDVILSDMAPDTTGIKSVDQENSFQLVKQVFALLPEHLKDSGHIVIKAFESHSIQIFLKRQKSLFRSFSLYKPKSTRSASKEFFIVGKGYIPSI